MPSIALSIVIPCYNESARIPRFEKEWCTFLSRFESKLKLLFPSLELIFVNDGSSDDTLSLLNSLALRLRKNETHFWIKSRVENLPFNQGKGAAVKQGILVSQGQWILLTDVDVSIPLETLFHLANAQVDFAFGNRALKDSKTKIYPKQMRHLFGWTFNYLVRLLIGIPFEDTQCGFKLINGNLARAIAPHLTESRFAFDVELFLLAHQRGTHFKAVPITWSHQEPSRVNIWKDGFMMGAKILCFFWKYPRWNSKKYLTSPKLENGLQSPLQKDFTSHFSKDNNSLKESAIFLYKNSQ